MTDDKKSEYDPFKARVFVNLAMTKDLNDMLMLAGLNDYTFFNDIITDTILKNEKSFMAQIDWELNEGLMDKETHEKLVKNYQKLKKGEKI